MKKIGISIFALALTFTFFGVAHAATISVPGDEATVQDAVDAASPGDTIILTDDIVTTEQITIDKAVTLDGAGFTLEPAFSKTNNSNNSAIGITGVSGTTTVQNLIIDGSSGTDLHGINTYLSDDVVVTNVEINDINRTGIVVNGSTVSVSGLTTSGSGWHAINVDQGGGVVTPSVLNISEVSMHAETAVPHIFVDDATKDVVVNDIDSQYVSFNPFADAQAYFLKSSLEAIFDGNYVKLGGGIDGEGSKSKGKGKGAPTHSFDGLVGYIGGILVGEITVNYHELNDVCTLTPNGGTLTLTNASGIEVFENLKANLLNFSGSCTSGATTDSASIFAVDRDGSDAFPRGAFLLRWNGSPSDNLHEIDDTPGFGGADSWEMLDRGNIHVVEQ